jgi:hypothetical protein
VCWCNYLLHLIVVDVDCSLRCSLFVVETLMLSIDLTLCVVVDGDFDDYVVTVVR